MRELTDPKIKVDSEIAYDMAGQLNHRSPLNNRINDSLVQLFVFSLLGSVAPIT
jgi:hypothetical protein